MKRNPGKTAVLSLCVLALAAFLSGCLAWMDDPDEPVEMHRVESEDHVGIEWEGRRYFPFCVVTDYSDMGKKFGYLDGDPKWEIHLFTRGSSDQWLVEYYRSGEMDVPMLYKEEHVTEIPEGLESERERNE